MKLVVPLALLAALAAACRSGGNDPAARTTNPEAPTSRLEQARQLIRDCRVKSTVSLHSGVFYLELKNGSKFHLSREHERRIFAALQAAQPPCGPVVVSME